MPMSDSLIKSSSVTTEGTQSQETYCLAIAVKEQSAGEDKNTETDYESAVIRNLSTKVTQRSKLRTNGAVKPAIIKQVISFPVYGS